MTDKDYDPRSKYEFIPGFLVILFATVKCIAYISPFIASFTENNNEIVGLISSIADDSTFDMILGMSISFWFGKKVGEKPG
jgi:hypothetical protein